MSELPEISIDFAAYSRAVLSPPSVARDLHFRGADVIPVQRPRHDVPTRDARHVVLDDSSGLHDVAIATQHYSYAPAAAVLREQAQVGGLGLPYDVKPDGTNPLHSVRQHLRAVVARVVGVDQPELQERMLQRVPEKTASLRVTRANHDALIGNVIGEKPGAIHEMVPPALRTQLEEFFGKNFLLTSSDLYSTMAGLSREDKVFVDVLTQLRRELAYALATQNGQGTQAQ